jgi:predicted TIM-barrel fold metal-dependent hydrolase
MANGPSRAGAPALFDANALLGPLPRRPHGAPEDVSALLSVMDDYGIDRALVAHTYAKWHHPAEGNARLLREIAGHERLAPCWVVMPAATGEVPPERDQVARLLDAGARAARLCSTAHRLSLEPFEVAPLLAALAERRVPLLLDCDNVHWSEPRPWRFVEWAALTHPDLPLVLLREPQANLRTLAPLLERCPNVVVETSYFQAHDGIALLAERFGPHRLVFGTGLPVWDPALPITGLTYAGLSPEALAEVAGGTLTALLDGCPA